MSDAPTTDLERRIVEERTFRGFEMLRTDSYLGDGKTCVVQQSSGVGEYDDSFDRPGSSALWIGSGDDRPHLDREGVKELRDALSRWLESGHLFADPMRPESRGA